MTDAMQQILKRYRLTTVNEHRHALKEVLQEIVLLALWRAKFFEHAAFYGGTALRILFGLDRFSEDLDFSLLTPNRHFDLQPYQAAVETELRSWGVQATVRQKQKNQQSAVLSAFLKANTLEQWLRIGVPKQVSRALHKHEQVSIRLELDTDPPPLFETVNQVLLLPVAHAVRVYDKPDLFAGKLHAVLCRQWKQRVKGRDWYDLVWFVGQQIPLHVAHLEARMRQTGHYSGRGKLTPDKLRQQLEERIDQLDIELAKQDVANFLSDRGSLEVWSHDFFRAVIEQLTYI